MPELIERVSREINEALSLLRAGQTDKAVKRAKSASRKYPCEPSFPRIIAFGLAERGQTKAASTYFEKAWRLNQTDPVLMQNYALSLISDGQTDAALRFIEKTESTSKPVAEMLYLKALAMFKHRDDKQALYNIDAALAESPIDIASRLLKSQILIELRDPHTALVEVQKILEVNPTHHAAQLIEAKIHGDLGQMDQAFISAQKALVLNPEHPETLRFISELPALPLQEATVLNDRINQSLQQMGKNKSEDSAVLRFAAAGLARRIGNSEEEWRHLDQAHAAWYTLKKSSEKRGSYIRRDIPYIDLAEIHDTSLNEDPAPVFVIGLPRSGTTLVEQILGAHSQVQSMGELILTMQWDKHRTGKDTAEDFAQYYRRALPSLDPDATTIVDKMPGNYKFVGLILRAFPRAVVINVTRDPRDIAVSMWRTFFAAEGMLYSHNWTKMADEANYYRRCLDTWEQMFPGHIHQVHYEELVNNKETEIPRLSRLCGLAFEPMMLEPNRSAGNVRTASQLQIRRPIQNNSIGNWYAHRDRLAPFISGLDTNLWPEVMEDG